MSKDVEKDPFWSISKYTCSFAGCDLQFKRKDRLDAHEFTHSEVKKYKCTEQNCDKSYTNSSHLQRHIKSVHAKQKEIIQCLHESCVKYFDTEARMKLHYNEIHSEKERDFCCEVCQKPFRRKTQLKQHIFSEHTGRYPYSCDKCGKGFLLMSRLKRHLKSHETRQCEHCDATFDKWSLLLAHKNKEHQNSDLKCPICNKEFHSMRVLKKHTETHKNLEDRNVFQCTFEECSKFFLQKRNLQAHYKSVHEKKRFSCTYEGCTMELSTKQKLELHIKVMHLSEPVKKPTIRKNVKTVRKDKGVQKTSTASKFFNIVLPPEIERAILAGHGENIHIDYDRSVDEEHDYQRQNLDSQGTKLATERLTEGVVEC